MKKQQPAKICANEFCGKEFIPRNCQQLTCCEECSRQYKAQRSKRKYHEMVAKKAPLRKVCIECGKEFETDNANIRICSPECSKERDRRHQREYNERNRKEVTRICEWCKEEFTTEGKGRFCSEKCRSAYSQQKKAERKGVSPLQPFKPVTKAPKLTGKALMQAQGVLITGKTDLQIAEEARAAGMSAGRYRALLQMKYEKERGIGFYASK